jgi:hypothetical protein
MYAKRPSIFIFFSIHVLLLISLCMILLSCAGAPPSAHVPSRRRASYVFLPPSLSRGGAAHLCSRRHHSHTRPTPSHTWAASFAHVPSCHCAIRLHFRRHGAATAYPVSSHLRAIRLRSWRQGLHGRRWCTGGSGI